MLDNLSNFQKENKNMPKKVDLRIKRTNKLITQAFIKLLRSKTFDKITINDISDEAMSVEMTNAPKDLTIRKGLVSKIEVRVRGPKGLVRSLDRRKWTYSLDVSRLKVGENLVDIDRERIPLSMMDTSALETKMMPPGQAKAFWMSLSTTTKR